MHPLQPSNPQPPNPQAASEPPTATDDPRSRKTSLAADAATAPGLVLPPAQISIDWSEIATTTLKTYAWQDAKQKTENWRRTSGKSVYAASQGAKRAYNLIVRQTVQGVLSAAKPLYPALQTQLESIENPQWELDIAFTDDATMQRLNAEHRGKDKPTDVLSFPVWEGDFVFPLPPGETNIMLGDMVISIETAIAQTQELKHDLRAEVAFLAAHGALHLLGYNHGNDTQRRKMFALQDEIVARVREAKGF